MYEGIGVPSKDLQRASEKWLQFLVIKSNEHSHFRMMWYWSPRNWFRKSSIHLVISTLDRSVTPIKIDSRNAAPSTDFGTPWVIPLPSPNEYSTPRCEMQICWILPLISTPEWNIPSPIPMCKYENGSYYKNRSSCRLGHIPNYQMIWLILHSHILPFQYIAFSYCTLPFINVNII